RTAPLLSAHARHGPGNPALQAGHARCCSQIQVVVSDRDRAIAVLVGTCVRGKARSGEQRRQQRFRCKRLGEIHRNSPSGTSPRTRSWGSVAATCVKRRCSCATPLQLLADIKATRTEPRLDHEREEIECRRTKSASSTS